MKTTGNASTEKQIDIVLKTDPDVHKYNFCIYTDKTDQKLISEMNTNEKAYFLINIIANLL